MHVTVPVLIEYLPLAHATQVLLSAAPLAAELLPVAQDLHVEDAVTAEYFPPAQFVHATEARDAVYLPLAHATQVLLSAAPLAAELLPVAQDLHVDEVVAASEVEYFPPAQFVHATEVMEAAYLPATQLMHVSAQMHELRMLQAMPVLCVLK